MKKIIILLTLTLSLQASAAVNNVAAADAYYSAFKASLGWSPPSADDAKFRAAYEAAFGALLNYLKANMDVLPTALSGTSLNNPSGQTVTVSLSTGIGSTTAPKTISGMGSVQ